MMRDAESHADEDKRRREVVETKNQAENLVYSTRKSMKELGDKVDGATIAAVENAANDLEEALKGDDTNLIQQRTQALQEAAYKLSEVAYQQAQGSTGGPRPSGDGGPAEDEVVEEAEYEVIDEE
jgi:molecular chaperone DnaK